jgi:uncharacterized protein (TIGR02598 family)
LLGLAKGRDQVAAQNKHQKDNVSQSDIFSLYNGEARPKLCSLSAVVVNGATPQVASETEWSCCITRLSMVRMPPIISGSAGVRLSGTKSAKAAFTLVEVVIAVGLVAFVLTAILGLAVIATNETKNADLKARLAWITERVTSEYQGQRFSEVLGNLPATNYWDYSGVPVTNTLDAYFRCDVSNVTPPPATNFTTNNFALLQVSIRWPYSSLDSTNVSTNVSLISVFNYH